MSELIKQVQEEIKEAYEYFDNEHHFNEVFDQVEWDSDYMRLYDCGYIKGMQNVLSKLQEEYGEAE